MAEEGNLTESLFSQPNSVIFLDADDVFKGLYSIWQVDKGNRIGLDRHTVMRLNLLAENTGSVFVISATERRWHTQTDEQIRFLYEGYRFNPNLFHPTDCRTATVPGERGPAEERAAEILEWLSRHHEVKRYVAIDDMLLMNVCSVHVDGLIGFTLRDYNRACFLLERPEAEYVMGAYKRPKVYRLTKMRLALEK